MFAIASSRIDILKKVRIKEDETAHSSIIIFTTIITIIFTIIISIIITIIISAIFRVTMGFPIYFQTISYTDSASKLTLCPPVLVNGPSGQDEVTHFDTFVVAFSTTILIEPDVTWKKRW